MMRVWHTYINLSLCDYHTWCKDKNMPTIKIYYKCSSPLIIHCFLVFYVTGQDPFRAWSWAWNNPHPHTSAQKPPVERHEAFTDTLLVQSVGLDWKASPSTTAKLAALSHTHVSKLPLTMTAKKPKNSDKSAASSQEDAPKKTQKSSHNGASAPGPQGSPRPGSCLSLLVTTVFYVALIGAAGFAAFHVQQALDEIRQTSAKHEESARQSAELSGKVESVVQQVGRKEYESMDRTSKRHFFFIQVFSRTLKGSITL